MHITVDLYGNSQVMKDNPANEYLYDYLFFDNSLMDDSYYYSKTDYATPSWIKIYEAVYRSLRDFSVPVIHWS